MTVAIDTSSLLSFVRYYLPFDSKDFLFQFLKEKIKKGEIVVIDEVYKESFYMAKGGPPHYSRH